MSSICQKLKKNKTNKKNLNPHFCKLIEKGSNFYEVLWASITLKPKWDKHSTGKLKANISYWSRCKSPKENNVKSKQFIKEK